MGDPPSNFGASHDTCNEWADSGTVCTQVGEPGGVGTTACEGALVARFPAMARASAMAESAMARGETRIWTSGDEGKDE